jgi:hypothetical protein
MKTTNVLSYHNDPAIKTFHVAQAKHHLAADMLMVGTYGFNHLGGAFCGCSVGCMAHDIDPTARYHNDVHKTVADHAGWPLWLVHLNDVIFEGLPRGARETFHVQLREAIPVGVDLEPVRHQLVIRHLDRLIACQEKNLGKHDKAVNAVIAQTMDAIRQVRQCHEAEIAGHDCDWVAARKLAGSAASAAEEVSWSARLAARSAARSAEGAKWSVANTAADWLVALRSASWETVSSDLLELLSESK